jgi:hypothetical protein
MYQIALCCAVEIVFYPSDLKKKLRENPLNQNKILLMIIFLFKMVVVALSACVVSNDYNNFLTISFYYFSFYVYDFYCPVHNIFMSKITHTQFLSCHMWTNAQMSKWFSKEHAEQRLCERERMPESSVP